MFTAILLACFISNPNNCVEIVDVRGPYRSETRCEMRLEEMKRDSQALIQKNKLDLRIVGQKCSLDGSA